MKIRNLFLKNYHQTLDKIKAFVKFIFLFIPLTDPSNKFKMFWDLVIVILIAIFSFFIPIIFAFKGNIQGSDISLFKYLWIFKILFIFDILLNLNTF